MVETIDYHLFCPPRRRFLVELVGMRERRDSHTRRQLGRGGSCARRRIRWTARQEHGGAASGRASEGVCWSTVM
jgi:hypothetical protein